MDLFQSDFFDGRAEVLFVICSHVLSFVFPFELAHSHQWNYSAVRRAVEGHVPQTRCPSVTVRTGVPIFP